MSGNCTSQQPQNGIGSHTCLRVKDKTIGYDIAHATHIASLGCPSSPALPTNFHRSWPPPSSDSIFTNGPPSKTSRLSDSSERSHNFATFQRKQVTSQPSVNLVLNASHDLYDTQASIRPGVPAAQESGPHPNGRAFFQQSSRLLSRSLGRLRSFCCPHLFGSLTSTSVRRQGASASYPRVRV